MRGLRPLLVLCLFAALFCFLIEQPEAAGRRLQEPETEFESVKLAAKKTDAAAFDRWGMWIWCSGVVFQVSAVLFQLREQHTKCMQAKEKSESNSKYKDLHKNVELYFGDGDLLSLFFTVCLFLLVDYEFFSTYSGTGLSTYEVTKTTQTGTGPEDASTYYVLAGSLQGALHANCYPFEIKGPYGSCQYLTGVHSVDTKDQFICSTVAEYVGSKIFKDGWYLGLSPWPWLFVLGNLFILFKHIRDWATPTDGTYGDATWAMFLDGVGLGLLLKSMTIEVSGDCLVLPEETDFVAEETLLFFRISGFGICAFLLFCYTVCSLCSHVNCCDKSNVCNYEIWKEFSFNCDPTGRTGRHFWDWAIAGSPCADATSPCWCSCMGRYLRWRIQGRWDEEYEEVTVEQQKKLKELVACTKDAKWDDKGNKYVKETCEDFMHAVVVERETAMILKKEENKAEWSRCCPAPCVAGCCAKPYCFGLTEAERGWKEDKWDPSPGNKYFQHVDSRSCTHKCHICCCGGQCCECPFGAYTVIGLWLISLLTFIEACSEQWFRAELKHYLAALFAFLGVASNVFGLVLNCCRPICCSGKADGTGGGGSRGTGGKADGTGGEELGPLLTGTPRESTAPTLGHRGHGDSHRDTGV